MTDKEKIKVLKKCFEDTIWMAIRYAHGRNTYAPSMIREAVKSFQFIFPEWKPKHDVAIESPDPKDIKGMNFRSDYLDDLLDQTNINE